MARVTTGTAETFNMRLTEQDRDRLAILVAHHEVPATTVVRLLLRREVESLGEDAPKKKPAAAKKKTAAKK